MTRKPLPDDFNVTAFSAAKVMVMLEQQVGIPLRSTIDMDLQPLHDLMRMFVAPEDRAYVEHIIIIDDETAELLKDLMWSNVARLRPERETPEYHIGVMSRSVATGKLDCGVPAGLPLVEFEALLFDTTVVEEVILEDADDAEYGIAMTRLISGRPTAGRRCWIDRPMG